MDWIEAKIYTTHEGIEPVAGILLNIGVTGYTVEDARDFEEFLESETPHWDYVDESLDYLRNCETSLTVYFPNNEQGVDQFSELRSGLTRLKAIDSVGSCGRLEVVTSNVREEDWANNWKQFFKPTPVGDRILIKPTWETLDPKQAQGRTILEIDPSASFGTGTHHTTKLCLRLLEKAVTGGEDVLDMGCGSGILGIAALLLGANRVTAVDIDENSVRIARENFEQNKIDVDRVQTYCGDINTNLALRDQICGTTYGIVVANIVADILIAMLSMLRACMADNGMLLLSGIIEPREEEVRAAALSVGLTVVRREEENDWVALQLQIR